MAIPKAFGFEDATQQSTSNPRFHRDRIAPAQAEVRAMHAPSEVEGSGGFTRRRFVGFTRHRLGVFTRRRFGGFTLAEAMMATVVLGIAAAGVLLPFASGAKVRAEGVHSTLAAKLAADLIEQIVNTPFDDIVATYNYSEPEGQVRDATETVFTDSNYAKFSRDVTCEYVTVPQQPALEQDRCNFIRVTVRVCYDSREIITLRTLIAE